MSKVQFIKSNGKEWAYIKGKYLNIDNNNSSVVISESNKADLNGCIDFCANNKKCNFFSFNADEGRCVIYKFNENSNTNFQWRHDFHLYPGLEIPDQTFHQSHETETQHFCINDCYFDYNCVGVNFVESTKECKVFYNYSHENTYFGYYVVDKNESPVGIDYTKKKETDEAIAEEEKVDDAATDAFYASNNQITVDNSNGDTLAVDGKMEKNDSMGIEKIIAIILGSVLLIAAIVMFVYYKKNNNRNNKNIDDIETEEIITISNPIHSHSRSSPKSSPYIPKPSPNSSYNHSPLMMPPSMPPPNHPPPSIPQSNRLPPNLPPPSMPPPNIPLPSIPTTP